MFIIVAVIAATASVWPPAAVLSVVLLAGVVSLKYPMSVASVTIVASVLLPDYIGTRLEASASSSMVASPAACCFCFLD